MYVVSLSSHLIHAYNASLYETCLIKLLKYENNVRNDQTYKVYRKMIVEKMNETNV